MAEGEFSPLNWHRAVLSERCSLDALESLVMLALVKFADERGRAYPGFGTLAKATRVSRSKVVRSLAALEARGLFVRQAQTRGQGLGSNTYTLPLTAPTSALWTLPHATDTSVPQLPGSVPQLPPVVSEGHGGSVSGTPYLPIELTNGTTQGTARGSEPRSAPMKGAPKKARKKAAEQPMPTDWQPSEAHTKYAAKHGLQLEFEVDSFRGWADGKKAVSWDGTFTTRLANQAKWNRQRASSSDSRRGAPNPQRGIFDEGMLRGESGDWLEEPEKRRNQSLPETSRAK